MKLNEKGIKSFEKQVIDIALSDPETYNKDKAIRHIDFQPEHFDSGMVWLTVENAKTLLKLVGFLKTTLPIDAIFDRCAIEELKEQIEQVEKR